MQACRLLSPHVGFRCCYCFNMNEARKQRPNAPRLNLDTTVGSSAEEEGEEELDSDDSGMNDVCGWVYRGR